MTPQCPMRHLPRRITAHKELSDRLRKRQPRDIAGTPKRNCWDLGNRNPTGDNLSFRLVTIRDTHDRGERQLSRSEPYTSAGRVVRVPAPSHRPNPSSPDKVALGFERRLVRKGVSDSFPQAPRNDPDGGIFAENGFCPPGGITVERPIWVPHDGPLHVVRGSHTHAQARLRACCQDVPQTPGKLSQFFSPVEFAESDKPFFGFGKFVDLRGIEPLTSSLRTKRATNCATGPSDPQISTAV